MKSVPGEQRLLEQSPLEQRPQPIQQLLREWPPGYGGVERVAHELAMVWGGAVWSLDAQGCSLSEQDAIPAGYPRRRLARTPALGRLVLPLPSAGLWLLLRSHQPLHGHLPSIGVLLVLLLARLLRPRRRVTAHWHFFFEPASGFKGRFFGVYQWLALRVVSWLSGVITTSPSLKAELVRCGCRSERVTVLPCCLSHDQEAAALVATRPLSQMQANPAMHVLFIGRLGSYKRLDWLLHSLASVESSWSLDVVGDGPRRAGFEALSDQLTASRPNGVVRFHGRLSEADKLSQLLAADLLVLPSESSNEAFGIVQLEAMAAGLPALAFQRWRSGMGWVCELADLDWSQTPEDLPLVLQKLADDPVLLRHLGVQARVRYEQLFCRKIWLDQLECWSNPMTCSQTPVGFRARG